MTDLLTATPTDVACLPLVVTALARPVFQAVGLTTTFVIAGVVPVVVAVVATRWARLPEDEIAHPPDFTSAGGPEERGAG